METHVIDTPRLRLVPLTLEVAEAIVHGLRPADPDEWAPEYPSEATLVVASMLVAASAEGREDEVPAAFQLVRRDTGRVIGGAGAGRTVPDGDEVRVAHFVVPSEAGQGFEAEAVRALVGWAHDQPDIARVRAEVAADDREAMAVYEAAGMLRRAAEGGAVAFEA